ncbi:MAG TPA: DUF4097 family beta strand repeat-containing protein, partial [Terriglobales bacterium]
MTNTHRLANRLGFILGTALALLLSAALGHASDAGSLTEEFHQSYPIAANGRVSLENVNGPVHISVWDREEVKVDAVKRAWTQKRLDEAQIKVSAARDYISIHTEYPEGDRTFNHSHDDPASVEYTLTVPRGASLDKIDLVNGSLDIDGVTGEVHAECINGNMNTRGLQGQVKLSSVNGRVNATFDRLVGPPVELESVNGAVLLTLPSDASADLEASTVSGSISDDFGIGVARHRFVGQDLRGQLGPGGTRIRLDNVNGKIEIRHANDGKTLSPAKSTSSDHDS